MSGLEQKYYIREPQAQDKEAWLALWPDYAIEFKPEPEALNVTWERLLDETMPEMGGLLLFSAEKEELVGFLHYVLHRTTWYEGYDCYVEDACIKPEYRYQGAFAVFYNALVEQMKDSEDCRIIYWRAKMDNYPACAAYDKIAERTSWVRYEHKLIETEIRTEKDDE